MNELYHVALVSFLANGGSYLYNFPAWIVDRQTGDLDYDVFNQYVAENSPINMAPEGRISVHYHLSNSANVKQQVWLITVLLSLVLLMF